VMSKHKDPDLVASRAIEPTFFKAPHPSWSDVTPSPYQHAAVEYRIARRHCLIGDAPGLGKTAEAILYGNSLGAKYTLVVCPASLRLNWEREIRMWSTIPDVTTYPVMLSRDGINLNCNYVIISYDLLRNEAIMDALLDVDWDHLILDEAHALKDPKGNKRTKAICAPDMLPSAVERMTLLSGTILPNQPIECYNAVRLMNWDAIDRMSVENFRDYFYEKGGGWVRKPVLIEKDGQEFTRYELVWDDEVRNQPVNLKELQVALRKNVMVRRLKEEVLTQLPKKRWHVVPVGTSSAVRKVMNSKAWSTVEKLHQMDLDMFDRSIPVDGEVGTVMRQFGEAKAPLVADYIEDLLEGGVKKLLVGCWHVNTLEGEGVGSTGLSVFDYLVKRLSKYGLVKMDGTSSSWDKQHAVDRFQEDEEVRVILGQLISIGEGWTLTAAQDAVLAEFYWVPGKNDQFLDRLHRRGQKGEYVIGHVPIVPGSIDERVIGTAVWKDQNIYQALDEE